MPPHALDTMKEPYSGLRFQDETLAAMRLRLRDFAGSIGIQLRGNGKRLTGLCPMHDDKDPSFTIFGNHHEICGCYPCDFKGDVFDLSQRLGRSSNFPEAVRDVAGVLGYF